MIGLVFLVVSNPGRVFRFEVLIFGASIFRSPPPLIEEVVARFGIPKVFRLVEAVRRCLVHPEGVLGHRFAYRLLEVGKATLIKGYLGEVYEVQGA